MTRLATPLELYQGLMGATDAMGKLIAENMPKPPDCDDWVYRDIPWITQEDWNRIFTDTDGHTSLLAATSMEGMVRGQMWVSPTCVELMTRIAKGLMQ